MNEISVSEYMSLVSQKKNKYNAKKTVVDGISFHSKLEARYYQNLKLLKSNREVKFFLRQVPFYLPGNTKYILDFMVFYSSGRIEYVEVKGKMTPLAKLKIKQVEDLYPIKISVVNKF